MLMYKLYPKSKSALLRYTEKEDASIFFLGYLNLFTD